MKKPSHSLLPLLLPFTLATLMFVGCGLKEPDSGTFSNVYTKTLKSTCIECHVPTGSATVDGATLDFSTQDKAYQTLLAATASGQSSTVCTGVKIVNPGSPSTSYLAAVLFSEYNTANFAGVSGCQPYTLHLQDRNLSSDEKTSITTWIQNGAKND